MQCNHIRCHPIEILHQIPPEHIVQPQRTRFKHGRVMYTARSSGIYTKKAAISVTHTLLKKSRKLYIINEQTSYQRCILVRLWSDILFYLQMHIHVDEAVEVVCVYHQYIQLYHEFWRFRRILFSTKPKKMIRTIVFSQ